MAVCDELIPTCRKSSSISSTLANNDFDERSFNSNSFIRLVSNIVFRVIFFPGRPIRKIHGSHCRNTALIYIQEMRNRRKKVALKIRRESSCVNSFVSQTRMSKKKKENAIANE